MSFSKFWAGDLFPSIAIDTDIKNRLIPIFGWKQIGFKGDFVGSEIRNRNQAFPESNITAFYNAFIIEN